MQKKVLSYDLGGTKVAVGVVNSRGKILEEVRVPAVFEQGKAAVLKQLATLGSEFLQRHPDIKRVGIASAGPLDPKNGLLLDPTNFVSSAGSWGCTPICKILGKKLKKKVYLENDAAAAVLAEHWIGAGKKYNNLMILTLGTGLGTGIICNGELVRSGRNLHPEAGHIILRSHDASAPCGCGNLGCAEAFLSGRNFTRRARQRFADPTLTAIDLSNLARKLDPRAVAAFEEYAELMAVALHNYARIYNPELVVFTGSFAATSDLFLQSTKDHLTRMLKRERSGLNLIPKMSLSALGNSAGLVGGAYIAFNG